MVMHVSIEMHVKYIFTCMDLLCVLYAYVCGGVTPWKPNESTGLGIFLYHFPLVPFDILFLIIFIY